jgi:hypothetical protein
LRGQSIQPSARRIGIGLAYVLDDAQVTLETVDMSKCPYVALVDATIS